MEYLKKHQKWLIIAAGVLLILVVIQGLGPKKVIAHRVSLQNYIPSLLISGEITARNTVISALTAGTVVECPVAKGDLVLKGQLMVQIDDQQARLDMDKAAAALEMARSQLEQARTVSLESAIANNIETESNRYQAEQHYNRVKVLAEAGAVSQTELEDAEQAMKTAQAKAQAALANRAALEQNGASLAIFQAEVQQKQLDWQEKKLIVDKARIEAPADGKVLDIYTKPGESVSIGTPSVLMAVGEGLRVKIKPDQRYAELATVGNRGEVWLTSNSGQKYSAQVTTKDPLGDVDQGSITAELQIYPEPSDLYPGQLVTVQLYGAEQDNAMVLPEKYLAEQSGQSGVWIAQNNRAHFVPVQLGLRTPEGVVILKGVQVGDVVLETTDLQEGNRIRPVLEGN